MAVEFGFGFDIAFWDRLVKRFGNGAGDKPLEVFGRQRGLRCAELDGFKAHGLVAKHVA